MENLFMKKKALVTGGTKKDVAAMAVLVINIKQTNPNLVDEIVIFHDGISERDQMIMNSIFPCRFIYYQFPGYNSSDFNTTINDYFSPMVFCKYECFRLLDEYQIVIWSDYDVIILKDISELLEPCSSNIKMILSPPAIVRSSFTESIKEINLKYDLEKTAICMSLFVLFDSLNNYQKYYEWCIEKAKELGKHLYFGEQAIVDILLQEFNIELFDLHCSQNIYSIHPVRDEITDKTKIIHAYGQPKFWNGIENKMWEENYKEWINIGGSKIPRKKNRDLKSILSRFIPKIIKGFLKRELKKTTS